MAPEDIRYFKLMGGILLAVFIVSSLIFGVGIGIFLTFIITIGVVIENVSHYSKRKKDNDNDNDHKF